MNTSTRFRSLFPILSLLMSMPALGCGEASDTSEDGTDDIGETPEDYAYQSRFDGEDSVSYSGQTFRHVLIHDLTDAIGGTTASIDIVGDMPMEGELLARFEAYYDFDDNGSILDGSSSHGVTTELPTEQSVYADIGSGKNLSGKIAGADTDGHQHADWNTDFVGWGDPGSISPDGLVRQWLMEVDALAVARANGDIELDPDGNAIGEAYVNAEGQDLKQLTQKFLLGAVTFSQGTDDYLDEGLDSDNIDPKSDGANYTALEHAWDEAFGYFGAARDYADYTDEELAGKGGREAYAAGWHDTDGGGTIDLGAEYNFGHATNAAKRDLGSSDSAPTDMTAAAFDAFLTGRQIIASADGNLDDAQRAELEAQRDIAVANWEAAIAATVVHYINDTIKDMNAIGSDDYAFLDHAKHWSELKGFALSFQFNPSSPLSDQDFARLHELIGDAPVLEGDIDAAVADLLEARALLGVAYEFDDANLGDEAGEGGW